MTTARLKSAERKASLLAVAAKIARKDGLLAVNASRVARDAKVTRSLMSYYFEGLPGLRSDVLQQAANDKDVKILGKAFRDGFDITQYGATRAVIREARQLAAA